MLTSRGKKAACEIRHIFRSASSPISLGSGFPSSPFSEVRAIIVTQLRHFTGGFPAARSATSSIRCIHGNKIGRKMTLSRLMRNKMTQKREKSFVTFTRCDQYEIRIGASVHYCTVNVFVFLLQSHMILSPHSFLN